MKNNKKTKLLTTLLVGIIFFTACHKDPEGAGSSGSNPPTTPCDTCPAVIDTFSLSYDGPGWGRLEGIPLLGYGRPTDRRFEARKRVYDAMEKMKELGYYTYYKFGKKEISMNGVELSRLYMNKGYHNPRFQKNFFTFIGDRTVEENMYEYLSDTVVLFITGGPDWIGGGANAEYYNILSYNVFGEGGGNRRWLSNMESDISEPASFPSGIQHGAHVYCQRSS